MIVCTFEYIYPKVIFKKLHENVFCIVEHAKFSVTQGKTQGLHLILYGATLL